MPARVFAHDTSSCFRTRMKHIDCAQNWVRILRDKTVCIPARVNTNNTLADVFTKILSVDRFRVIRSPELLMYERPHMH